MFPSTVSLRVQKKMLRVSVNSKLRALPAASIEEQSRRVHSTVLSLESFKKCKNISCYLSMPTGELDTTSLTQEILKMGKNLFVPRIDPALDDNKMRFLRIHGLDDLDALPRGIWGIREPEDKYNGVARRDVLDPDSENLDMILVPGVAFDETFSRLGHGKGYYDRFLWEYVASGRPKPLLVALSLEEQLLEGGRVPVGPSDWKMDVIVTPDECLQQG